jgi:multidrug efflux system membrane fusion protein
MKLLLLFTALFVLDAPAPSPDVQGIVLAFKPVSVSSPVLQDVITAVLVEEGDTVKEGQPLVQLRSDREELAVLKTEKQMELAEFKATGLEKLFKEGIGHREKMLEEKANLELVRIFNREAQVAFKEKTIRAPISGIVVKKYKEAGESVDRVEKLIDLVNIDQVFVQFSLDPKFMETVKLEQAIGVRFPLIGNADFTGKVVFIDPRIEATTGTSFRIKVLLDNPGHKIKPGMRATANFAKSQ